MGYEVWNKSTLEIDLTTEFRNCHMMVNKTLLKFVNYQFKNHSFVISDGLIGIANFLFVVRRFGLSNGLQFAGQICFFAIDIYKPIL